MFQKRTVIITGAGASWHYGYPTGETLVQRVIEKAKIASEFFKGTAEASIPNALVIQPNFFSRYPSTPGGLPDIRNNWFTAANECSELAKRLTQVRPLVIDYFLGQNESLREIGKLMIAWVIRECAIRRMNDPVNYNRRDPRRGIIGDHTRDDWYRFMVHKLVSGCASARSLHENQVTFVTFNYDVSLEWYVEQALASIELFSTEVHKFFQTNPVLHIYGNVIQHPDDASKSLNPFPSNLKPASRDVFALGQAYQAVKELFDRSFESAQRIRTIGPHEKGDNVGTIERARAAIARAECVYLLGYGFDENNSALIQLPNCLWYAAGQKRAVLFTNYENRNVINKKASHLFFRNPSQFLPPQLPIWSNNTYYCEKSTESVYDALERDFDSVEETAGYPLAPG
jgi:hypothetical protein